ncbi:MAG: hypothetical protein R2752_20175 [Vicinamibacterales bacterium]
MRPQVRRPSRLGATACGALVLATALAAAPILTTGTPGQSAPIVKITGEKHKLLLRADGTVAGWGLYRNGQLGPVAPIQGTSSGASTSLVAIALPGKAVDVAAGTNASYALLDDGTVVAWGRADAGQLGNGNTQAPRLATSTQSNEYRGVETPARVAGLTDVAAIAAANDSAYAVLRDGTVRSWGNGAIGDGRAPSTWGGPSGANGPAFRPVAVPGLSDVAALSAGGGTVLALLKDGRVFSWGSNFYGALGRPPRTELALDTPGEIPDLRDVAQVAAGSGVSTALLKDGTVRVWGSNWQQQFGFRAPTTQPNPNGGWVLEPQPVPGVAQVTSIAVGNRHTLALLKDGTLRAWGNTDFGQTGNGAGPGYQPLPIAIKITSVATVFAAGDNSFALRADGSLWAWGVGWTGAFPFGRDVRLPAPAPPGLR